VKYRNVIISWLLIVIPVATLNSQQHNVEILVVQEAWHTGIVIETRLLPDTLLTELDRYDHFQFLDIGWGDRDFYQTPGFPVWYAFKAIFWPTTAVLRIAPFNLQPGKYYSTQAKLARIQLSENEFIQLCKFIGHSFQTNDQNRIIASKLAGFYIAERKYSTFRTCNTWAARALQSCGLDIRSFMVLFAWQLFRQLDRSDHEITYLRK
jgi:uncharacterized protein (TIGR02117 family)